ncbi:MAG TPA: hypothetical protein VKT70_09130 [Stellaceae bacterium]|nr:hypothetical protein [Stellaceae bacterium]
MKTYAQIVGGQVVEIIATAADITTLYHPSLLWIDITSVMPAPQLGWSYSNGTFAPPPPPPPPTLAQTAQAMLAGGCQISSSANPGLSATYACDPQSQSKIMATALYIQVNGKFPAKQATLIWADITGAPRVFGAPPEFSAFATAVGDFVAALDLVIGGASTSLPAQPMAIP